MPVALTTGARAIQWSLTAAVPGRALMHAQPAVQMRRSTVVGDGGKSVADGIRTSYGTFIK